MGRFLEKTFPLSRVSPSILSLTANALSQVGPAQEMLELLEQVSTYLPSNSLWRERHGQHSDFVEKMEIEALAAAEKAADLHYNRGIVTSNRNHFHRSSTLYHRLEEFAPNHERSSKWIKMLAHSHFSHRTFKVH